MAKKTYMIKLIVATVAAYLSSFVVTRYILLANEPKIRTEFREAIISIPQKIAQTPGSLVSYVQSRTNDSKRWLTELPGPVWRREPNPVYEPPNDGPVVYNPPEDSGVGGGSDRNPPPPPGSDSTQPTLPPQDPTEPSEPPRQPPPNPPTTDVPPPTQAPFPTMGPPPTDPPAPAPSDQASAFLTILNAERAKTSARPLQFNAALNKAAQDYANVLSTCDHFQGGTSPVQRARAAGYGSSMIGENITCGGRMSAEQVFNMWMGSPPHRSNMLNASFSNLGVGIGNYGWVLDLGN